MVEAIIIWLGAAWLGYKWFVKRQFKYIVLPIMLIILQFSRWPFFLDYLLVFGLLGVVCGVMMSIESLIKKQIASTYPYIVGHFAAGGMLLLYFFSR